MEHVLRVLAEVLGVLGRAGVNDLHVDARAGAGAWVIGGVRALACDARGTGIAI